MFPILDKELTKSSLVGKENISSSYMSTSSMFAVKVHYEFNLMNLPMISTPTAIVN